MANNIARVDAPLKVGNVSEVVTVGAEVAALQTDKSDLHADIAAEGTDADRGGRISQFPVYDGLHSGHDAGPVPERLDRFAGARR